MLLRVPPVRRAPQHKRTRLPPQARSAVYLPDVIPEQGWTKAETVDSLVRKSGYTGQAAALGSRALVLQLGSHTPARGGRASPPPDPAHTVRRPCTPPRSERGPWHRSGLGTAQLLTPPRCPAQISESLRAGIKLTRFQSTTCTVSYDTWFSMRDRGAS